MRDEISFTISKTLTESLLLLLFLAVPALAEYQVDSDVVTDTETGLMWMQSNDLSNRYWLSALDYCHYLELHGYTDWRLPNVNELVSLVDYGRFDPAIDPVFACPSNFFWSSSPSVTRSSDAWRVNFSDGLAFHYSKDNKCYVRCVRGGP